jgi:hypothetical protein
LDEAVPLHAMIHLRRRSEITTKVQKVG